MCFTCTGFQPAPRPRSCRAHCRNSNLDGGPDAVVDAVLEGAAALAEGEFAPLADGRRHVSARGGTMASVTMPPGFKEAWRAFVEGGWMRLAAPEEHGGQGLPLSPAAALMDNLNAANVGSRCARCCRWGRSRRSTGMARTS